MKKLLLIFLLAFGYSSQAQFWQEAATSFSAESTGVADIVYVDVNTVWVTAYNGLNTSENVQKWAKSSNGGLTWTNGNINVGNAALGISSIAPTSATTAHVMASPSATSGNALGGVWGTTDGGVTWNKETTAAFNSTGSFPNMVYFFNANDGVTMGDPVGGNFEIYTTTNGGALWNRVPIGQIAATDGEEFGYTAKPVARGNTIWFGTDKGRIYRSTDKGLNWTVKSSPIIDFGGVTTPGSSGDMTWKDDNNGLLTDNQYNLWRTTDGGETWETVFYSGEFRTTSIEYIPGTANTYIIGGNTDPEFFDGARGVSVSQDGGDTWIDINALQETPPNAGSTIKFFDATHGLLGGFTTSSVVGGIFYNTYDYNQPLATSTFSKDKAFTASPNPTSGMLQIAGKNIDNVTAFDVLGKQVLNANFSSLNNVDLNLSALNSGIYIVKVTNNGGAVSTLKVVKQ